MATSNNHSTYSSLTLMKDDHTSYDLHQFIEMGCWNEVGEFLRKEGIGDIVSVPYTHRDGDFPLHAVCDFKFDGSSTRLKGGDEVRQEVAFPPPTEIVLGILRAFPNAAKVKGARGCLPLHNATRRGAPREVMDALIRAFPQSLDVKNDDNITPRDYIQTEENCNLLLERPTSCWLQHSAEEKINKKSEDELLLLENEVRKLEYSLSECRNKENILNDRLAKIEIKLSRQDLFSNGSSLAGDVDNVCVEISDEIEAVSNHILLLRDKLESKYLEDSKNRTFINEFNDDMMKIYKHLESELSGYKNDLENISKLSRLRVQQK